MRAARRVPFAIPWRKATAMWRMSEREVIAFTLGHLRRMFPDLTDKHVLTAHVWRARYAQPVVDRATVGAFPAGEPR